VPEALPPTLLRDHAPIPDRSGILRTLENAARRLRDTGG